MDTSEDRISLQINVTPTDLPICIKLLERQISFWYDEVDEIVLSIESQKSYGRYALNFDENKMAFMEFIGGIIRRYPKMRYHLIDYSEEKTKELSRKFFQGKRLPQKDYHGCAFYSYFDGIASCRNRYVMHLDSDMILAGKRNSWLRDAVSLLKSDPSYLIINPLAGPPTADLEIHQKYHRRLDRNKFLFQKMSTRIFLTDMDRLMEHPITLRKVAFTPRKLRWYFKNGMHRGYELVEVLITEMMERDGLYRVDTAGVKETDCYSLHPVRKPPLFIESIPSLLERIDKDDIPAGQRGHYNITDDFFNFSKAP